MSDIILGLGGFIDKIGKQFFEKGAKQAAKEFNYATEEHHETVTGLPFVDNKGRPLEPPRSLAKIKDVEKFLKEIKVGRGIKQGHGQVALGCDRGKTKLLLGYLFGVLCCQQGQQQDGVVMLRTKLDGGGHQGFFCQGLDLVGKRRLS